MLSSSFRNGVEEDNFFIYLLFIERRIIIKKEHCFTIIVLTVSDMMIWAYVDED